MVDDQIQITVATTPIQIALTRELFLGYAQSLDFKLCFQSFDEEVAGLPGKYAEPDGCIFLATANGKTAGCIAVRKLSEAYCEMKRLWVRPEFRNQKIGKALAYAARNWAKTRYKWMRLDTVASSMATAVRLYRDMSFYEIEPYTDNPVAGAIFMECDLRK